MSAVDPTDTSSCGTNVSEPIPPSARYAITTFYKFVRLSQERVQALTELLSNEAARLGIEGLLLLGVEGCNATIAGDSAGINEYKKLLLDTPEFGAMEFKDSVSYKRPFRRFKVDVRDEIVAIKLPIFPELAHHNHLSPAEWHQALQDPEVVILDTRNFYETELGHFKGALTLDMERFSEFPEKIISLGIPREKKVLMYCTGGIRCEKALIAMQGAGYDQVFQLQGGILKYLEEFPEGKFEGECFVFDHRVAVDSKLQPSTKFSFCPHCGNPASIEIACGNCGADCRVCERCKEIAPRLSCSKNCAYHLGRAKDKDSSAMAHECGPNE